MSNIVAIFDGLVERDQFLSKDKIQILADTLNYAVKQGEICKRNGYYSVTEVLTKVLGFNKAMWQTVLEKNPEVKTFAKKETFTGAGAKGGSPKNMISEFGVFYIAAILGYAGDRQKGTHLPLMYVYRDRGNRALKVGATINLKSRKEALRAFHPFVELIATFDVDTCAAERALHRMLYEHSIPDTIGWYPDTEEVRTAINDFMLDRGYIKKPHKALIY